MKSFLFLLLVDDDFYMLANGSINSCYICVISLAHLCASCGGRRRVFVCAQHATVVLLCSRACSTTTNGGGQKVGKVRLYQVSFKKSGLEQKDYFCADKFSIFKAKIEKFITVDRWSYSFCSMWVNVIALIIYMRSCMQLT